MQKELIRRIQLFFCLAWRWVSKFQGDKFWFVGELQNEFYLLFHDRGTHFVRLPCAKGAVAARRLRDCFVSKCYILSRTIPPPRLRSAPPFTQGRLKMSASFGTIQSHFSLQILVWTLPINPNLSRSNDKDIHEQICTYPVGEGLGPPEAKR